MNVAEQFEAEEAWKKAEGIRRALATIGQIVAANVGHNARVYSRVAMAKHAVQAHGYLTAACHFDSGPTTPAQRAFMQRDAMLYRCKI